LGELALNPQQQGFDFLGRRAQPISRGREHAARGQAIEKTNTERFLKRGYPAADGAEIHPQMPRGG
jgi:hypothetical protein